MELSRITNDPRMQCLDPDLLRAFVIIADTRSFTRAAERLLRTQPAISLQMKRLEEAVGRSLLKRNPRLVRLTPAGEVLLDYARRILALNDDLLARVKEPDLVGTVRLERLRTSPPCIFPACWRGSRRPIPASLSR
jgi:DNA-binding transcriptional LysR family regulator